MSKPEPRLISTEMAIEALKEQVSTVAEAEQFLTSQRGIRDNLILSAILSGIRYRRIMEITGLSRERIVRIVNKGKSD